ncbi:MAG: PKD domain-containing protein, partial [Bacteroidetes bacterium]|nr:PKD domain-containing protein [Bacteroidota bacterium]
MRRLSLFLAMLFAGYLANAQYTITTGGTVNTCSGTFTAGSYSAGQTYTLTICGDGIGTDNHTSIFFTAWNVPAGDLICVYDGPDDTYTLIGCYDNSNWGSDHAFTATPANLSGCLTMVFTANSTSSSWSGNISCIFSCQPFYAVLDYTDPPVDGSGIYTNVCPGQAITFSGYGDYYMNDTLYNQSDANCSFVWFFGDGASATGQTVTHTYTSIEGFNVSLVITDQNGCVNLNELDNRVRISTEPTFVGTGVSPASLCVGETATLNGVVNPTQGSNAPDTVVAGTTYLPDGSGASYSTSITMTIFEPGQVLEDVTDLIGICVNMEHSYLGDLVISITCPDGSQVILEDQGGGGTFLGEPIDVDDPNQPGVGYDYCWDPFATNGTLNDNAGGGGTTLPAGNYQSYESMNSLIGCPLNGNWTITVTDNWSIDDGFIFYWGINFNPSVYPPIWSYTPAFPIYNQSWAGSYILPPNGPTVTVEPDAQGTYSYTFTAVDDYGCEYDTTLTLTVFEPAEVSNIIHTCVDSLQIYYVEFDISGGNGPYAVVDENGFNVGVIDGNGHFTMTVPNDSAYYVEVSNENTCNVVEVFSIFHCGCGTYSGTMVMDPLEACQGISITTAHFGDEQLNGDDLFEFIIHDGSGSFPYTALATSDDPTFFDSEVPGISYGQLYYISAVAGYNDGNGHVDPTDPCYSQSMGTPVMWIQQPTASIPLTYDEVCGKIIQLDATTPPIGNGYWSSPTTNDFYMTYGTLYTDADPWVGVPTYGVETFVWTVYNGQCVAHDSIVINFMETPTAYAGPNEVVCGGTVDLAAIFSVGDNGEWTGANVLFSDANSPTSAATVQTFGDHVFTWTEYNGTGPNACWDDDKVRITFIESPDPDAGTNDTICGVTGSISVVNTLPDSISFGFWHQLGGTAINISDMFSTDPTVTFTGTFGSFPDTTVAFVWYERNLLSVNPVCDDRDTVLVTFISMPSANAGLDDEVCGSTCYLDADMSGTGYYSMATWSVGLVNAVFDTVDCPTDQIGTGSVAGTHDPDGIITITSLGAFGDSAWVVVPVYWIVSNQTCNVIDSLLLTFNQKPEAFAGVDDSICGKTYEFQADRSLEFSSSSLWTVLQGSQDPNGVTYIPTPPIETDNTVNINQLGVYYFQWEERNPQMPLCRDRDTVVITFLAQPQPNAGDPFFVCGKETQLNATPSSGIPGSWVYVS